MKVMCEVKPQITLLKNADFTKIQITYSIPADIADQLTKEDLENIPRIVEEILERVEIRLGELQK